MLDPLVPRAPDAPDPFDASPRPHDLGFWRRGPEGTATPVQLFTARRHGEPVGVVAFEDVRPHDGTAFVAWTPIVAGSEAEAFGLALAALDHGFGELGLEKLSCEVTSEAASARLLDLGFRREGTFRGHVVVDGARRDLHRLALPAKDWRLRRAERIARSADAAATPGSFEPGAHHEVRFALTGHDLQAFADLTGDTNPIHLDDGAARALGFDGRLAHGMLTAAVFSRVFGAEFPGEGCVYVRQDLRFVGPVYPDRGLVGRVEVTRRVGRWLTLRTTVEDETSERRVIEGEAELLLPKG